MSPAPSMQALVDDYLVTRRAMGYDLRTDERQLRAFARFADQQGHQGPITVALATRWAQHSRCRTRLTWARRLQAVRPFTRYRAQFDVGTEIAPAHLFGPTSRRLVPHIYTETEVASLLQAAAHLRGVAGLRLRPHTYVTLFGLLASTGLRLGEALALSPTDVDLPGAALTVRQTKCRKSRLVPLHATTVTALSAYVAARRRRVNDQTIDTFLVSDRAAALDARMAEYTFAVIRARLGWKSRGGHASPRIHDLRQHAGSRLMPGSACCLNESGWISRMRWLRTRHNHRLSRKLNRWSSGR